jgi:AraC-like DNA-binding protein
MNSIAILKSSEFLGWDSLSAIVTDEQPHIRNCRGEPNLWFLLPKTNLDLCRRIAGREYHRAGPPELITIAPPYECVQDIVGAPVTVLHVFIPISLLQEVAAELHVDYETGVVIDPAFSVADPLMNSILRAIEQMLDDISAESKRKADYLARALVAHVLQAPHLGLRIEGIKKPFVKLTAQKLMLLNEYLEKKLDSKISIASMSALVGFSRTQFLRRFKSTMGTSPHQWVMTTRIQKAKELLANSDLSLAEIAKSCGFASQTHLATVFRRFVNLSPTAYREIKH